jgi:hypothetical protein
MLKLNQKRVKKMTKLNYRAVLITGLIGITSITPLWLPLSVSAQLFPSSGNAQLNNSITSVIPVNTKIPVKYKAEKIVVTKEETVSLTLDVAANFKNSSGTILIPYESKIVGKLEPFENGTRFVAEELIINNNIRYPLDAVSQVVTKTEVISKGSDVGAYLKNAAIGAAAAAVISGITGDRAIATEEVLIGAGAGALGTLIFGRKSVEVISIDPNQDLELTLLSSLTLNNQ